MRGDETNETAAPSADNPQCCMDEDHLSRQIEALSTAVDDDADIVAAASLLTALPPELLQGVLLFCGAGDIEDSVKKCCKSLRAACRREALWKNLCRLLGKRCDADTPAFNSVDPSPHRRCYLSSPCVPVDCASISEAIKHVERLRRRDVAMNHEGKYNAVDQTRFTSFEIDRLQLMTPLPPRPSSASFARRPRRGDHHQNQRIRALAAHDTSGLRR